MSRTFSTNSGSVESLNVSLRCGCKPNARQMRPTVVALRPTLRASPRVLQRVAFVGVCSSVVVSARSTSASPLRGGDVAPRRFDRVRVHRDRVDPHAYEELG